MQTVDLNKLELFAARFMVHHMKKPVCQPHRDMCKALSDHDKDRVVIEFFRGGGKSTWGSLIYPLWEICEGDYDEIQIFAASGGAAGLSTKILNKVKREIENNDTLKYYYGLEKGAVWGAEHIQIVRYDGKKIDLYSRGKHASARGHRGLVIIDDPQSSDDCRSETVLNRDEEWLFSDILPILLEGQRLVFIATSISPLSLCSKVKTLPGWHVLEFTLEDPVGSGKSVWPEQYSNAWIEKRKAESGGIERFNAEYNCMPLVSGNPVFKVDWMNSYDPETIEFQRLMNGGLYVVSGMDGAESKASSADYTAILTLGATYDKVPKIYVLDARRGHWTTKEGAEQLFLVYDQFHQHKSIVESRVKGKDQHQRGDALIEEIRAREQMYNTYVNCYPVRPDKDKVSRAHYVQPSFQQGQWYFNKNDKFQQQLISELTMFTGDGTFHDDMVDGLVHAGTEIRNWAESKQSSNMRVAIGDSW